VSNSWLVSYYHEKDLKTKFSRYRHASTKGERKYNTCSFFFNLTLNEMSGQRHHTTAALSAREGTPGTHWIGGWVGLRAGLDIEARL
jgi:hypothetical protein